MGLSGQTHASLRSSVYHRLRSLFGSSVWSSSVCLWRSAMSDRDGGVGRRRRERRLRQWLRHVRLSVQMALAKFSSATPHNGQGLRGRVTYAASRSRNHLSRRAAESPARNRAAGVARRSLEPGLTGSPSCCSARGRPTRRRTWSR